VEQSPLTGPQSFKKFPGFCGKRKFITAFTIVRHLSLFWARPIQFIPPYSTPWRPILILSSIHVWVFQVFYFPQVSPPKSWMHRSSPPYVLRSPHISLFSIWSSEQNLVRSTNHSFSLRSPLHSFVVSSLIGSNISHSTLFSNTLKLYSSLNVRDQISHPYKKQAELHFRISRSIYVWRANWRHKILHRIIARIPCLPSALNCSMNGILIRKGHSQISELFHPFKRTVILYSVTSSCILISRHEHVLSFLSIYF